MPCLRTSDNSSEDDANANSQEANLVDFIDIAVILVLGGLGFFFYSRPRRGQGSVDDVAHPTPAAPPVSSTNSELGGVDLYRAFITGTKALVGGSFLAGPSDVERYVKRFHRRDEVGVLRPGWHWPALFVAAPWLVYRRMYLVLVLYVVVGIVIGVIGDILFPETELSLQALPPLGFVIFQVSFGIPYFFLPPMFADTVYWWHTNRMIRRAQQEFVRPPEQIAWLRKKGGTASPWLVVRSW